MKPFFLITILILAVAFLTVGVLDYLNIIRITWTPLIIAFTAAAPVLKLISNWLSKPHENINQLKQIHSNSTFKKVNFNNQTTTAKVDSRDVKIAAMKQEIMALRQQVKTLEDNMKMVDKDVDGLPDDELNERFVKLYGN